jgi:4'-phosphopantetheinyl transferase
MWNLAGRPAPPAVAAPAPGRMTTAAAAPEVRWLDIRAISLTGPELADLGPQERGRAAAFVFPADRRRYQVAHVALRQVLSGRTGIPAGQLEFSREPCPRCGGRTGRPALAGHHGLHFSLSHSADAVVIAISATPVGIDLERMTRRCSCDLADAMHQADAARVRGLPEPQRHAAIMRWWVAAEAVLKCTGAGIAHGMADFPVLGGGPAGQAGLAPDAAGLAAVAAGLAERAAGCRLRPLAAPPGYAAAIAVRGGQLAVPVTIPAPGRPVTARGQDADGGSAKPGPSFWPAPASWPAS